MVLILDFAFKYVIRIKLFLKKGISLPWLITTSPLISVFQISGRISETLGRGSQYPAKGLSLDLKTSLQILGRRSWVQISWQGFHQIWSLNQLRRRKPILSICISRLLHRIWYLIFQMFDGKSETLGRGFKLSAEDLDI